MDIELQEYIITRTSPTAGSCWVWLKSTDKGGYGKISTDGKWYKMYGKSLSHQLSYIAFNGIYPKEFHILHSCNNPSCCNPEHLRTGTQKENMRDMIESGRNVKAKGEAHGRSKLTSAEVEFIRTLIGHISQKNIGLMFGVGGRQISHIKTGRSWRINSGS